MKARKFDRRIIIERYTETQDEFGGDVKGWQVLISVSAARTDVNDSERLSSNQINSTLVTRFLVRHSVTASTINPKDRISFDGLWDILGVKEAREGRKRYIEITAALRSD